MIVVTLSLGLCRLLQTGNLFAEHPTFRMTIEGLIIAAIVGILVVIRTWRDGRDKHKGK